MEQAGHLLANHGALRYREISKEKVLRAYLVGYSLSPVLLVQLEHVFIKTMNLWIV